jgi:SET domain-containing protein
LPEAMRLLQNKFVRKSFGVYRSPIQGLGLFARRNIADGDVVIEYAGEVIRSTVADVRERRYESQGIGCYMFRHGDDDVVDATICGNFARFINHSCQPNCYSREIVANGRRHIMIFALRAIRRGEELTYDYKFPLEEVKMPCLCKAPRCRRYLN